MQRLIALDEMKRNPQAGFTMKEVSQLEKVLSDNNSSLYLHSGNIG